MKNFYRSSDEAVIAGVCAGFARRFDLNVIGLRWAAFLLSLFFSGVPVIIYLVLWAILKPRPTLDVIDV